MTGPLQPHLLQVRDTLRSLAHPPPMPPTPAAGFVNAPHTIPWQYPVRNIAFGTAAGLVFAAITGLAFGAHEAYRSARDSHRDGNGWRVDWPAVVEAFIYRGRLAATCGGFAGFLAGNALRCGLGITQGIPEGTPFARAMAALVPKAIITYKIGEFPIGEIATRSAVCAVVVGLVGVFAVGIQRLADTSATRWSDEDGKFRPQMKKVAQAGVICGTTGAVAGAVASLVIPQLRMLHRLFQ